MSMVALGSGLADEHSKLVMESGDLLWVIGRSGLSVAASYPCFEGWMEVNMLSKALSKWE